MVAVLTATSVAMHVDDRRSSRYVDHRHGKRRRLVAGDGSPGDDADRGAKNHVAEPVAIGGKARQCDVRRKHVRRHGVAPTQVALERRGKGEGVGGMTGWKGILPTVIGPLAPGGVLER